jgi:2-phosphosulfolactate phosphatase
MVLDTLMVPAEAVEGALAGRTVVVVDVLRSSTTMAAALDAGCREIVPCASVEEASRLAETLGRSHVVLCGERDGRKIEGFDLGNSPLEFRPETVKDKTLIMATTNGTAVLAGIKQTNMTAVACFNNVSAVCRLLAKGGSQAVVVCSGKLGRFSLEDLLCAGAIADRLADDKAMDLSDSSKAAVFLFRKHRKNLARALLKTQHGAYLAKLGFKDDIDYCSRIDSTETVPIMQESRIARLV